MADLFPSLSGGELLFLLFAVVLTGVIRGLAGFGAALVYLPLAAQVLPPVWAVISIVIFDLFGPLPLLRRAVRDGQVHEVKWLCLGALVAVPPGVWLLSRVDPTGFRLTISCLSLLLVAVLLTGWRYRGRLTLPRLLGVGVSGGFLGGFLGLPGPPVILFYMSSAKRPAAIRANSILYLFGFDLLMCAVLATQGLLENEPVLLGLVLAVPYTLANMVGQRAFNPDKEKSYRGLTYIFIVLSALVGLPVFD